MSWQGQAELLAGVVVLAIGGLLFWLFKRGSERPGVILSAMHLTVMPLTVMLIFVLGIALLCKSAGLI